MSSNLILSAKVLGCCVNGKQSGCNPDAPSGLEVQVLHSPPFFMQLLFSVTKNDLIRQTFCTGGNGGQHRNATQNGVRLIHPASGARAEHRDGRDQHINERRALVKLSETKEFKSWHKVECARRMGLPVEETPEQIMTRVDRMIEEGIRSGQILIEE